MHKRNGFLLLVLGFVLTGFAYAQDVAADAPETASIERAENGIRTKGAALGEWTQDYEAALALAKAEKKPVLLNFTGSDWCYWCKLMDQGVFSKPEWKKWAAKHLVCVWVDFPRNPALVPDIYRQRNQTLSQRYDVQGYPTFVLIRPETEEAVWSGGATRQPTPAWFRDEISKALLTVVAKDTVEQTLDPARAKAFLEKQAQVAEIRKQLNELDEQFAQWAEPQLEKLKSVQRDLQAAESTNRAEDAKALRKEFDRMGKSLQKKFSEKGNEMAKKAKPLMDKAEKLSGELLPFSKDFFQE